MCWPRAFFCSFKGAEWLLYTSFVFCLMQWIIFFVCVYARALPCLSNSFHFYHWYLLCAFFVSVFLVSTSLSCFCIIFAFAYTRTRAHTRLYRCTKTPQETRQNHLNAFLISLHPRQQRRVKKTHLQIFNEHLKNANHFRDACSLSFMCVCTLVHCMTLIIFATNVCKQTMVHRVTHTRAHAKKRKEDDRLTAGKIHW